MVPKAPVGALRGFSRWLFAKNKPSLVARLDSKSLSDGGDVYEFVGKGKPERLLSALDHLRSFRSTGEVIVHPRRGRAKDAPVVLGLEEALIKAGTRRPDIAAAQLSASSALRPTESRGGVTGSDKRPLYSEDAPVVLGLEEALIKAGTRRLDIAAAQLSASSALQPAQSRGVVTGSDMRPLYFEDARDISGLQEAFIKAGMRASAYNFAGPLRSFSRWLFAKNKPSLVARLDSKSLSGDVSRFIGKGNPDRLLRAIDELRTFRSTGSIALPGAQPNPHPPDVAPIHPENAVLMEPRLIGDAAAQHRASHEASSRREDLRERQEDQPAPSVLVQEHVAFNPEQISPGELRRVLDHLDDQSMPSPASVVPEELLGLEEQLHNEIQRQPDDQPVDPEEFTFNLEQFSPGELRRLLDTEGAQLEVDHLARQSPIDDWSTTSHSQWAPQPAYLLTQSVSQSNPPSWDKNFEAYTSGPADQSSYDPGPLPNLSLYLPLEWRHGAQWAPEDLKEGMRLHNVLPGASQPETNLTLQGVNYTATIGPPSYESEVFLRPIE
ncbi:hypothetical protein LMTR13_27190 [Bradyrhizobium icense]|uniref:Uncharacterized protein n=2 Tax=Bradyrhizobium icense TaxID=1274631 RepID=A0A1B1UKM8_9BRAD|nr:hypothetical protein LMTR13_27190 [Bradyrhizobium icense]